MNSNYGHKAILASVIGENSERPIWGVLQHGWTPFDGWSRHHPLPAHWPRLVWSSTCLRRMPESRSRAPYRVIGSPFAYLAAEGGRLLPERGGAIVAFPHHSSENVNVEGDHSLYAKQILEREGKPVRVCLYWLDFENTAIRQAYEHAGHTVVTVGASRNDRFYIPRWLKIVEGSHRVISNTVSTAVIYAAALGLESSVYGNAMTLVGDTEDHEAIEAAMSQLDLPRDASGELHIGRNWARRELGWYERLGPEQLAQVLGWRGVRSILAGPAVSGVEIYRLWRWRASVAN